MHRMHALSRSRCPFLMCVCVCVRISINYLQVRSRDTRQRILQDRAAFSAADITLESQTCAFACPDSILTKTQVMYCPWWPLLRAWKDSCRSNIWPISGATMAQILFTGDTYMWLMDVLFRLALFACLFGYNIDNLYPTPPPKQTKKKHVRVVAMWDNLRYW